MSVSFGSIAEKTFDNFKKITPALVAIAILTGLILFLPKDVLKKMNLDELPVMWSHIIGIVFLLSVALIATILLFSAISSVAERRRNQLIRENLKKKFLTLSSRQKDIVMQALQSEDKTISLDKTSGDTIYLVNNRFLQDRKSVV